MRELYPDPEKDWKPKIQRWLLDSDARFDDFIFQAGRWTREIYERFSMFMDRFHIGGWRRWTFIEPLSEGATLGLGGMIVMLALAQSAFRETSDDDWLKKSELAVTFLDRYGNEIGSRGIKHNDSIPLEEFPDALIKATLATEDRRFYEHFGIDIGGTLRAFTTNLRAGGVQQGGSSLSQQLAKNLFLTNERTIERKIKEAFLAIWLESRLTKNEILKLYLDRAYLGGGAFGVDAAAQQGLHHEGPGHALLAGDDRLGERGDDVDAAVDGALGRVEGHAGALGEQRGHLRAMGLAPGGHLGESADRRLDHGGVALREVAVAQEEVGGLLDLGGTGQDAGAGLALGDGEVRVPDRPGIDGAGGNCGPGVGRGEEGGRDLVIADPGLLQRGVEGRQEGLQVGA